MQSPVLKTDRLLLSFPFIHEDMDVSHHIRWLNDSAVTQYSEQRHITHTAKSQYEYLSSFSHSSNSHFWEIVHDGIPIGSITAHIDLPNKTASMGILLGERSFHGQGYAFEAWETVSDYLFERGMRKLEAGCMAANRSMVQLLERSGFIREAVIPGHFLLYGNQQDKTLYGKFREAKVIQFKK